MKLSVLSVFLFAATAFQAQSPDFAWAKTFSGPGLEKITTVSTDAQGNIYTSGYFNGSTDFDPGPGTLILSSMGDIAVFATKQDAQGNLLWAKAITPPVVSTNSKAYAWSHVLSSTGELCIAGHFNGVFDFDPGAGNTLLYAPNDDVFLVKLDAQGALVWAKQWGGKHEDMANGLAIDASDNLYTTGFFMDTVDFNPSSAASHTLVSAPQGAVDAYVSKLDASGNFVWVAAVNASSVSIGTKICVDAAGNVYSTGVFLGTTDFDSGPGTYTVLEVGNQDIYVWKLNSAGQFVWVKTMGGLSKEGGSAIVNDAAGNVFVSGFFSGTVDFDPGAGTLNLTSAGADDMFITKLDAQGNLLWARGMGAAGTDVLSAMTVDAAGSVYSTGQFIYTVNFDPGVSTQTLTSAATLNSFILKMDGQGNFKWVKQIEGNSYNTGGSVALDGNNTIYTAGTYSLTADFDHTAGTFTMTAAGGVDAYIHKMTCISPPALQASSSSTLLCAGSSATLTPSGAATYSWNSTAGTALVIQPLTTTDYTLSGVDANGCSARTTITQQVLNCTGLQQVTGNMSQVTVYPNPNAGEFVLDAPVNADVTIFNGLGELVYSGKTTTSTTAISVSDLAAGVYFIKTNVSGQQHTIKMVKTK